MPTDISKKTKVYCDLDRHGFSVVFGDAKKEIDNLKNRTIKLLYGSPPYPNAKRNYRTWKIDNYIEEISPFLKLILPKMRSDGFIVINIKANRTKPSSTKSSERSLIVEELMMYLKRELGLYCVDIEVWVKSNPVPTGLRVACQDSYEYNIWFSISPKWEINIDNIRREYSDTTLETYNKAIYKPRKNGLQYVSKEKKITPHSIGALPINVIYGAVSSKTIEHQAVQPDYLSEKYIRACTNDGDIIVDPWMGSGTTGIVAARNNRKFIGFEILESFYSLALNRITDEYAKMRIDVRTNE